MSTEDRPEAPDAPRGPNWIRIASIGLVVAAAVSYVGNLEREQLAIPLVPLEVSESLETLPSIPAPAGALHGYNLVLVTMDTTRPDRLGLYGNARIRTPTLDRLAANGVVFSNAYATAPVTLPTHASVLTGLYPHHHGARANVHYRLEESHRTLAEALSDSGYDTGAFVSALVLDEQFGLAQGFDQYDDEVGPSSFLGGVKERHARATTSRAVGWLRRRDSRPFFIWVHYFDPHVKYDPPPQFAEQSENPYEGEIAFVDEQLGRLLEAVESANGRESLVVVVADHAESLGEKNEWSHAHLVQEATIKIPLLMHAPKHLGAGIHVNTRVSQVDLVPTIGALLGIEVAPDLDGVDLALPPDPNRAILAETVEGEVNYGWARLTALYRGAYKYVEGPTPELFDLNEDPLERRDLSGVDAETAASLRRHLQVLYGAGAGALAPPTMELSENDVDRLAALGYVVTAGGVDHPPVEGPDPNEMLPLMFRISSLISKLDMDPQRSIPGRLLETISGHPLIDNRADLIDELEQLASEHPDFAPVYRYLAIFYEDDGQPDEAARARSRMDDAIRGIHRP